LCWRGGFRLPWEIEKSEPIPLRMYASDTESASLRLIRTEKIKRKESKKAYVHWRNYASDTETSTHVAVKEEKAMRKERESRLEEGVQMISYASDTESASLRVVRIEDKEFRLVKGARMGILAP
jgi:hypothetical protein